MTSFIINAHVNRKISPSWDENSRASSSDAIAQKNNHIRDHRCIFCQIIADTAPAYKVYETEQVIAILDIQPLRSGHVLVIPKDHYSYVSEVPEEIAGELGKAVSKVAKALTQALDNNALNVVCNQIYAQAVKHVHYHIIPAPRLEPSSFISSEPSYIEASSKPMSYLDMHRAEFEARHLLEDSEAQDLVQRISSKL